MNACAGPIDCVLDQAWVNTFTRCMAQEMAETGVRIVCVNPGYCNTHMVSSNCSTREELNVLSC